MEPLDFEGALSALQAFLGHQVRVTASPLEQADTIALCLVGPLAIGRAEEGAYLERDIPAAETVTFRVGDHGKLGAGGVFILWRDHFDGAATGETAEGLPTVILFDRGVGLGVTLLPD